MDALSALKMVGAPNLTGLTGQLNSAGQAGGGAGGISPADLQQLTSLLQGGSLPTGATTGPTAFSQQISPAESTPLSPGLELGAPGGPSESGSSSFQNMLGGLVQEVSDKQAAASQAVSGLLSGKNVSLHQTMISVEEASVSFQLMVEVRNRLLDSYQELMRMQV